MLVYSLQLGMDWEAPDFELPDTAGNLYKLGSLQLKYGILIIFTCNHCPYAKASWPVLIKLYQKYYKRGVDFVAINSNDGRAYPEDSSEEMKKMVSERLIPFPYLRDESQEVAKKYQVQCTPEIYLLDKNRKIFYHGRINDNWHDPKKVERQDLADALHRLVVGDKPPVEQFPSMGCSIKWK